MISQNQKENMSQQQHMLMPTYIMTKSLAGLSLHAYTLLMPLLLIGIPKGNLQMILQLLALNLWQPELLQIKSLTSGTLSCILEHQPD